MHHGEFKSRDCPWDKPRRGVMAPTRIEKCSERQNLEETGSVADHDLRTELPTGPILEASLADCSAGRCLRTSRKTVWFFPRSR
jgi:hypothetical protein